MHILQNPGHIRPSLPSLPPMYTWPMPLKRAILVVAIIANLGAYMLLIGGLLGAIAILLEFALDW